jgi:hypothetical protein
MKFNDLCNLSVFVLTVFYFNIRFLMFLPIICFIYL